MAFTQQKFLNSSIASFNCSIGWNSQESRLTVNLVDDTANDDYFSPPPVGTPVVFDYQGWQFAGLLEKYTTSYNSNGAPLYEVSVVDPRVLLDGVQVILSDYSYGVGALPNILNVFGALESQGFGESGKNESGILWNTILVTAQTLANSGASTYGGPIKYKGYSYKLNLQYLPPLPPSYRISGSPSISLMELISEVCSAAGSEFFVRLINDEITIYTISRANIPNEGVINQFVTEVDGAISKMSGQEMVNDTCAKFLIGGKKTNLSVRTKGSETDYTNPIWQYWGYTLDGNVVLSENNGNDEAFTLDMRAINFVYGSWYPTNVGEVRAALVSKESWESYISLNSFFEYNPVAGGQYTDNYYTMVSGVFQQASGTYKHDGIPNPHFRKSLIMNLPSDITNNIEAVLDGEANPYMYMNLSNRARDKALEEFYGMYRSYVEQYYGKQFMVELPSLYVKVEPDSNVLSLSQMPTDGGYLTDGEISEAVSNGLLPINYDRISLQDGRIECYARFNDYRYLDLTLFRDNALSTVPNQDILIGNDGISIFVKCYVDPNIVFIGPNFTLPRAIVTLPGIFSTRTNGLHADSIIKNFIESLERPDIVEQLSTSPYVDILNDTMIPRAVHPDLIAIPMESQVDTYGPWYLGGAEGKTEIENGSDLVPWNYGGYELMNLAANARVTEAAANLQWLETGSVEYPDVPVLQLGEQLLNTGPYVTDISVDISSAGAKTTYRMSSWTPRFGKMAKYNVDRMQKLSKLTNEIRRNARQMILTKVKR